MHILYLSDDYLATHSKTFQSRAMLEESSILTRYLKRVFQFGGMFSFCLITSEWSPRDSIRSIHRVFHVNCSQSRQLRCIMGILPVFHPHL